MQAYYTCTGGVAPAHLLPAEARVLLILQSLDVGRAERQALLLARHPAHEWGARVEVWGFRGEEPAVHEPMAAPPVRVPAAVRRELQRQSRAALAPAFREKACQALRAGDYRKAWAYYARLARTDPSALRDKQLLRDLLSLCKRSSLAILRR